MLRNLNQTGSRGRICGTPKSGVIGSLIPSTGFNGASYLYDDLDLPTENNDEFSGEIIDWPVGALYAYEDGSFTYTGNSDTFDYQLRKNGVIVGTATVTLTVGDTTIAATVGNAQAGGSLASINVIVAVAGIVGNAVCDGVLAGIYTGVTVSAIVGDAAASGQLASITTTSAGYARAPSGSGYSSQRNETQYRISAIQTQTRNPATQTQARPRSALKNNR